jgi:DNA-binding CsgD family transcriptional regulator
MDSLLQGFLPKLAHSKAASDVGALAIDGARQVFGSHLACTIFLDDRTEVRDRTIFGLREADFEEWAGGWRQAENVFPTAIARAMPVHRGQVYRDDEWAALPVVREYGRALRIDHYMAAPLFGSRGRLAGMLTMCRRPQDRPFDGRSLGQAAVFAGFLSASLARVMESPVNDEGETATLLTARELQIARLAAAGRNNPEIGLQLGLARETVKQALGRVYAKLGVRGRAPMAAWLASSAPGSRR